MENRPKNLLVVAAADDAGVQICYRIPFELLTAQQFATYRILRESEFQLGDLEKVDCLILYRCLRGETLSLARYARRKKLQVVYELDDDLLDPPADASWGLRYIRNGLPQIIGLFLESATVIKAGSPELAVRIGAKGFPVIHHPYPVIIREIPPEKDKPPCRIGYFGTPHHQNDITAIFPALTALEREFGDEVEFEFLGCAPPEWPKLKRACFLSCNLKYECFLDTLTARQWSIGLAPLQPTRFNGAKSNGKFRDYTAAGIPGIYADWTPYRDCVRHGVSGWLCGPDSEEWLRVIRQVLREEKRNEVLTAARDLVRIDHSAAAAAQKWRLLLGQE